MEAAEPAIIVTDTGPLLCTGLIGKEAIDMLYHQFKGRIFVPNAVMTELRNRAAGRVNDTSGNRQALENAAVIMTGTKTGFLKPDRRVYAEADLEAIRAEVDQAEKARGSATGHDHKGESEAILLAESMGGAIVLACDRGAQDVARHHGLRVATFATVLAVEVRHGRLDPAAASEFCEQLRGICFPGTHKTNPLDFTTLPIPGGFEVKSA